MKSEINSIAVIGLGYVGLPLSVELSKYYRVVGFDIDASRVDELNNSIDRTQEVSNEHLLESINKNKLSFSSLETSLNGIDFFIIAVPTPVNERFEPDLSIVESASQLIGRVISKGSIVVYESTVYPGVTEDVCIPIINQVSGMEGGRDFYFGYSPERINPGDVNSSVTNVVKITSGCCKESSKVINDVYSKIITAGTYEAESIKVAEAAKVFENVQRDVNIALVNEFSILCNALKIDTSDVLDAAATKWNFMKFSPGLVGGHCIGIDPYYLIHKANSLGYSLDLTMQARKINESMPYFIVQELKNVLLQNNSPIKDIRVLIMGYTFKEDCPDIRNTKVKDIINNIYEFTSSVDIYDPWVSASDKYKSGFNFIEELGDNYDAVIVAVKHTSFQNLTINEWNNILKEKPVLFDLKGCCNNEIESDFSL
jgi:UDP-N-acetyl-D-glucosamine/UDP-N-acetyl-D-galactosamine dehydrogenase